MDDKENSAHADFPVHHARAPAAVFAAHDTNRRTDSDGPRKGMAFNVDVAVVPTAPAPAEDAVLVLALFAKPPHISFGNVTVGATGLATLRIENPNILMHELTLDKWPADKGFSIANADGEHDAFSVLPKSSITLTIAWQPTAEGKCREQITLKWDGRHRVQALLVGDAVIPKKGSKAPTARRSIVPGVAQSRLRLSLKPTEAAPAPKARAPAPAAARKVVNPYAARNAMYDERWIEKQEKGFTRWLNFVLLPPDTSDKAAQGPAEGDLLYKNDTIARAHAAAVPRVLSARRRLNRQRMSACALYQSPSFEDIVRTIDGALVSGSISVNPSVSLSEDVQVRDDIVALLLGYTVSWLRLALETVFGELISLGPHEEEEMTLANFVVARVLSNEDVLAAYPTTGVREAYCAAMNAFVINRILRVVIFLDKAKLARIVDGDPCLFRRDSPCKSSRDVLLTLSRRYLTREGDITRHLAHLGYTVSHVQGAFEEYDYTTESLAKDLTDGARLVRLVETLTGDASLSRKLKLPATTRQHSLSNVGIVLSALEWHGIVLSDVRGGGVTAEDIVDGHREKTLALLWKIVMRFQVEVFVDVARLRAEVDSIRRETAALTRGVDAPARRESLEGLYFQSEKLSLLLRWCAALCEPHGVKVTNFSASFADGRALCLIVSRYHPTLLPAAQIAMETTQSRAFAVDGSSESDPEATAPVGEEGWSAAFSPPNADRLTKKQRSLAENERANFRLLHAAVRQIGGVPPMVRAADGSHANSAAAAMPDERVLITYVSYLCARLLDIGQETRAAIRIQRWWRTISAVRDAVDARRCAVAAAVAEHTARANRAATVVQSVFRARLQRARFVASRNAATAIQRFYRGASARKAFLAKRSAAVILQAAFRASVARSQFLLFRKSAVTIQRRFRATLAMRQAVAEYKKASAAVVTLQSAARMHIARKAFLAQKGAAVTIQAAFRAHAASKKFALARGAAIAIQRRFRATLAMRKAVADYKNTKSAAVVLQSLARMHIARKAFLAQKGAAVTIQAAFRAHAAHVKYAALRAAAVSIQRRYIATLAMRKAVAEYARTKAAVVALQSLARMHIARKAFFAQKKAAVAIQAAFRAHSASKKYTALRAAAIAVQRRFRATLAMRKAVAEYERLSAAVLLAQSLVRMRIARKAYAEKKGAAVTIQAAFRAHAARANYTLLRGAAIAVQRRFRATLAMRKAVAQYKSAKSAAVVLQSLVRMRIARKAFLAQKSAAVTIQAAFRSYAASKKYAALRSAAVSIQRRFRATLAMRKAVVDYKTAVGAIVTLQSLVRMRAARKAFLVKKSAATKIQAAFRSHAASSKYAMLRGAAIAMQRRFRATLAMRQAQSNYAAAVSAVVVLQSAARMRIARKAYLAQKSAAVTIQAAFRAHSASKKYAALLAAVVSIQRRFRATRAMRKAVSTYNAKVSAVVAIQSLVRMHIARKAYLAKKSAAVTIQAVFRAHAASMKYATLRTTAISVQRRFRATRAMRQAVAEYARTKSAAVLVQSLARMHIARKAFVAQKSAAVVIQAAFRAHSASKKYATLKSAAVVIQRRFRATLEMGKAVAEYKKKLAAVVAIQSLARMHIARKAFLAKKSAAVTIQAAFRAHAASKKYATLRATAVSLQRRFRATLTMRKAVAKYEKTTHAIVALQSHARGLLARKALASQRTAATKIQAAFRGHVARTRFVQLRAAAVAMQRRFRAALETRTAFAERRAQIALAAQQRKRDEAADVICRAMRRFILVRRVSAVRIQACVRGFLARRKVARVKSGIVRLQALWRGYWQRKQEKCAKLKQMRAKIEAVNATADEKQTLGNRTRSALDVLLTSKQLAFVLKACANLDVVTGLSYACCERMVATQRAVPILVRLIRSCNRSEPHMQVLRHALSILMHIAECPTTAGAVFCEGEVVALAVDMMQIYREREDVFLPAARLASVLCRDVEKAELVRKMPNMLQRIAGIAALVEKKGTSSKTAEARAPLRPVSRNMAASGRHAVAAHKPAKSPMAAAVDGLLQQLATAPNAR